MTFGNGENETPPPATPAFDFMLRSDAAPALTSSPDTASLGLTARPRQNRRRSSRVDSRAVLRTVVVITLAVGVLAAAGITAWTKVQESEAQVKADSAAMCAELATTPGVLSQPGFGWPTEVADITTTLASMHAYQERWQTIADGAPPTIRDSVASVAAAAATLTANVEASQSIDRAGNLAKISLVTSKSVVPAWVDKYCD